MNITIPLNEKTLPYLRQVVRAAERDGLNVGNYPKIIQDYEIDVEIAELEAKVAELKKVRKEAK